MDSGAIEAEVLGVRDSIITRLCSVYDPEMPVNIYDLGLIYRIALDPVGGENQISAGGRYDCIVDMTLTSVGCPMADLMPVMVRDAIVDMPELRTITVNLVWEPSWDPSRMSEAARFQLDMFD